MNPTNKEDYSIIMDNFTQVPIHSYSNRVGGGSNLKSMIVSPIMLLVGIWILISNEGKSIKQHQGIQGGGGGFGSGGSGSIVEIKARDDDGTIRIDERQDNKLVHIVGTFEPTTIANDYILGVSPPPKKANNTLLVLRRKVEMYQWIEERTIDSKRKKGGGSSTTKQIITYKKQWRSDHVASNKFHQPDDHVNPTTMRFTTQYFTGTPLHVGEYVLSEDIVEQMFIQNEESFSDKGNEWYKSYDEKLLGKIRKKNIPDETTKKDASNYGDGFFFGKDPAYPQVGDLKISYDYIPTQTISIIARQSSDTLVGYMNQDGSESSTTCLIEPGTHTIKEMLAKEKTQRGKTKNNSSWAMRFLGYLILLVAFQLSMEPLSTFGIADSVPILSDLLETGSGVFALLSATIVTFIIVGLSWLFVRPLLSLILFGILGGATYYWKEQKNRSIMAYGGGGGGGSGGYYASGVGGSSDANDGSWTFDLMLNSSGGM